MSQTLKKGKNMGLGGIGKILGGVGNVLNNITGATSAAKVSQQYALQSGAINHAYQKEFAQNAHQWEVADMEAAGINPMLSAGGPGASASGGGVTSASQQASGIDLLGTILNTYMGINNAKKASAEAENLNANTKLTEVNTQLQPLIVEAQNAKTWGDYNETMKKIEKLGEEMKLIQAQTTGTQAGTKETEARTEKTQAEAEGTKFETKWLKKHPRMYTAKKWLELLESGTRTGKNIADIAGTIMDHAGMLPINELKKQLMKKQIDAPYYQPKGKK